MSFILDALRKSESERQRDEVASVTRTPLAPAKARTPAWVWGLIATLSIALAAISVAWLSGTGTGTDSAVAARSPASEPAATGARAPATPPDPTPSVLEESSSAPLSIAALAAADP
ncbi:MAG: hypothetical protein R3305_07445, partial [Gammaproteobacteria bacterium]|nr:hypothetical protein [Gammaproteobacteria bacterium]